MRSPTERELWDRRGHSSSKYYEGLINRRSRTKQTKHTGPSYIYRPHDSRRITNGQSLAISVARGLRYRGIPSSCSRLRIKSSVSVPNRQKTLVDIKLSGSTSKSHVAKVQDISKTVSSGSAFIIPYLFRNINRQQAQSIRRHLQAPFRRRWSLTPGYHILCGPSSALSIRTVI